jgi:hypothetical protein
MDCLDTGSQLYSQNKKRRERIMKKLFLISLALVMILSVLTPATALAASGQKAPNSFSGSGLIYVTYMPDPVVKGDVWQYQGEVVEGFLDQCDWDLLAGTVFYSEHDSVVNVDSAFNANGIMKGTFSLTRSDGSGVLKGTFFGKISGNLYTGDISDTGTWQSTSGTGVFKNVKASGKWSAELYFNGETLIGPVTWSGRYTIPVKPKGIVKPNKPWGSIQPGIPIKPWKPVNPGKPDTHR